LQVERLEDRTLPSFGFGWAFNVGGTSHEAGTGITTDTSGNLYVTGWSLSSSVNFDPNHTNPNNPNNTLTNPGGMDLQFVAKYTSSKTFEWVTLLGTSNELSGNSAVDGAGNVYVAWADDSTHVAQLDAGSGTVHWNVSFAGSSASSTNGPHAGVAVGPSGDVYVAGRNASAQAFVAKLDPSGNVLWNQSPSGSSTDGLAVAMDGSENLYVAYVNGSNLLVGKLNAATGSTLWTGGVGSYGTTPGYGAGIAVDGTGNVYVTGGGTWFSNNGFFVAKLAPGASGSLTQSWNKKISGNAWSSGLAVDPAGNVYTTGSFTGSVNFNPGGARYVLKSASRWYDIFTSELDTNGNFVAAADIVRGSGNNYGHAIAVDNSSPGSPNIYATGGFRGTADFDPTSATYNLTVDGGSSSSCQDVFVSQLRQSSGGGATGLSSSNGGTRPAVLLATSPMTLVHFGQSVYAVQVARNGETSQRWVIDRASVFPEASARWETEVETLTPSRSERQARLLDHVFGELQDGALRDVSLPEGATG
jgi:hypothetical protein